LEKANTLVANFWRKAAEQVKSADKIKLRFVFEFSKIKSTSDRSRSLNEDERRESKA
jgi:hypothetical protein